jgi:hypothetical protein
MQQKYMGRVIMEQRGLYCGYKEHLDLANRQLLMHKPIEKFLVQLNLTSKKGSGLCAKFTLKSSLFSENNYKWHQSRGH